MLENLTPDQMSNLISAGSGLLGAVIGAGATLLSTWLAKRVQESGKLILYARTVYSKGAVQPACGYYPSQTKSGLFFRIALWVDACNTSGVSRIARNVNLHACYKKKDIAEFIPIQYIGTKDGNIPLGDNESNTLVIPANSARRFDLEFMLHDQDLPEDSKEFDELILTYFDEKNKIHAFHFMNIDKCWIEGPLDVSRQWITLDRRCKYAR